jgi:hypothetical protein
MTDAQLDLMCARVGSDYLRFSTSDANPKAEERERAREWVVAMAALDEWPPPCDGCIAGETPAGQPPVMAQVASAAKAAVRFVASGLKVVSRDEFDRRHGICQGCEHFDAPANRCNKCGCFLAAKPWGQAEHCPVGKW